MLRKALGAVSDAALTDERYGKIWFSSGVLHGLDTYVDYFNLNFNPQSEYL